MSFVLQGKNISFTYPQNNIGIKGISINLNKSEGILISGLSGSGKSTLTRCLSGLIPHLYRGDFSGEVIINGKCTQDQPMWKIANTCGLVFQNPAHQMIAPSVEAEILFGLENLGLSRYKIKERLEHIMQVFHLESYRERSPHTLSGGEQQKLALASIMARSPQIYIFDEPLSMLDSTSAIEFITYVESLIKEGKSAVICEHREQFLIHSPFFTKIEMPNLNADKNTNFYWDTDNSRKYPLKTAVFSLEVRNLSVEKKGETILNQIDLSLESGQITAIVGRNGTGKTTLLRSLVGLQKHTGKKWIKNGHGIQDPQFKMVFQNPDIQLFNPSVREEILFKIKNPDLELYHWLIETLHLERYENTPPLLLSEGEKRRLALAITIMQTPKHGILLDEPSLGQDQLHKKILINLLKEISDAGYLVIFTTHDLELASHADRMILLQDDGIAAEGKTKHVIHDQTVWNKIGLIQPEWMQFHV